jgi:hypothetical protein
MCFMLAYSSISKMEATCSAETSVDFSERRLTFSGLHGFASQKIELLISDTLLRIITVVL